MSSEKGEKNTDSVVISDIEKLIFLYRDEYPVRVEIWDTLDAKFNENYTYSQNNI